MSNPAASPCQKICVFDHAAGHCLGCGRTLAEIGGWLSMSDADRRAVIAAAERRLAAAPATPPAPR